MLDGGRTARTQWSLYPGSDEEGYDMPGGWNQKRDPSDYAEVVELWRRQDARSKRIHDGNSPED